MNAPKQNRPVGAGRWSDRLQQAAVGLYLLFAGLSVVYLLTLLALVVLS